ncbi:MAG: DUF6160 family protein [Marinobacter sp.]|uniref:DUF6160 family protein n=1 Tax=Marinobacter sp. TaxID=50741 RepID=UPI00299D094E|nr:DUF6160 family protein [Marinobacter sp.]MDX1633148.1 DUF6160 family protein [Marinobacter sp.]
MKGLKKLALATAVAAVPFAAQADLKALDDTSMGNVTGQAGVTIELETKVDIGSFTYTDEGNFVVSGIHIGGGAIETDADGNVSGVSGLLDDLKIDIDVEADGDAVIDVNSVSGGPVDFAVGVETASLVAADGSESTLLASNIGITGLLADIKLRVDTATDTMITDLAFNITDMDMDVDFLGIGIRDLTVTGANTFGATYADAGGVGGSPYIAAGFAYAQLTIGKATGVAGSASGEALEIGVPEFIADISIGATEIGGTSIGVISMDNLAITQTNMKIYGH